MAERSKADRLLGLRVRIPPGAGMFMSCCVVVQLGQKAQPGQSGQSSSTGEVQRTKKKIPQWCHWGFFPKLLTEPCALGSTQPLKMSTRKTPGGEGGRCVRVTTLPPS